MVEARVVEDARQRTWGGPLVAPWERLQIDDLAPLTGGVRARLTDGSLVTLFPLLDHPDAVELLSEGAATLTRGTLELSEGTPWSVVGRQSTDQGELTLLLPDGPVDVVSVHALHQDARRKQGAVAYAAPHPFRFSGPLPQEQRGAGLVSLLVAGVGGIVVGFWGSRHLFRRRKR